MAKAQRPGIWGPFLRKSDGEEGWDCGREPGLGFTCDLGSPLGSCVQKGHYLL